MICLNACAVQSLINCCFCVLCCRSKAKYDQKQAKTSLVAQTGKGTLTEEEKIETGMVR